MPGQGPIHRYGTCLERVQHNGPDTLSEADSILGDQLGQPLTTLCFEGPAESLNQTNVAQPALFAVGVAVWRALAEQGHQLSGAGLSLGEYTALVAAGAMDFADGLRVVTERGQLMQDAAVARAGGWSRCRGRR